jgi:hypothetical protein
MAVNDHAPLAPSSAHIWAPENGCRASVALQAAYPSPEDSPEAREGTAAHFYVTELLSGRDVPLGAVAPNGHPIDAEMVDCAQGILIDVRDTMKAAGEIDLRVERRVTMAQHVHPSCFGTPDVVLVDRTNKALHVWDYKYGHRFVDATRNWQLMLYAIGVLEGMGYDASAAYDDPRAFRNWRISVTIAQPRNYDSVGPMREWYLSGEALADYLPGLRLAAGEAMAPGAPYQTGEHCRDCSGRHACPALQKAGAIAMDVSLQAQPVDLPPHAVGLELRQIMDAEARLKARRTGLEEQALGLIRGGTLVPFFTTEHTSGRENWTVPASQVFALGDLYGVNLRKPPEPITPAQARKAGIDSDAMTEMARKPMGALRLARVNDDAAKRAFE